MEIPTLHHFIYPYNIDAPYKHVLPTWVVSSYILKKYLPEIHKTDGQTEWQTSGKLGPIKTWSTFKMHAFFYISIEIHPICQDGYRFLNKHDNILRISHQIVVCLKFWTFIFERHSHADLKGKDGEEENIRHAEFPTQITTFTLLKQRETRSFK